MATEYKTVFSEYEIKETAIKFEGGQDFEKIGCVGSFEEELETRIVTKKCEGVVVKSVTRGAGSGTVKMSLHINYNLYVQMFGMDNANLKDGVKGYGKDSRHKNFALVAKVLDEDGNVKFIAYPKCIVNSGLANKIENGADEVAEIELEVTIQPDDNGFAKYEAIDSALDVEVKGQWMTAFTPELVKKSQVM